MGEKASVAGLSYLLLSLSRSPLLLLLPQSSMLFALAWPQGGRKREKEKENFAV